MDYFQKSVIKKCPLYRDTTVNATRSNYANEARHAVVKGKLYIFGGTSDYRKVTFVRKILWYFISDREIGRLFAKWAARATNWRSSKSSRSTADREWKWRWNLNFFAPYLCSSLELENDIGKRFYTRKHFRSVQFDYWRDWDRDEYTTSRWQDSHCHCEKRAKRGTRQSSEFKKMLSDLPVRSERVSGSPRPKSSQ